MTTVRRESPPPSPTPPEAPLVPSSCRVSILAGESHQVDLVLPAAVPLSALTDATRDAINRELRARGEDELPPGVYEFARVAGMTALADDMSLSAQGVADADLLALVPVGAAQRYGPNIENVSTALARYAQEHFPMVSARDAVTVAAALTGAALAVAALIVWRIRWGAEAVWAVPAVFAGGAVVLIVAAMLCARAGAQRVVVDGAAWAGVGAAVLLGATAPYGAHPGAPHAFLASLVAIVGALMLARLTGRQWTAAAAVITAACAGFAAGAVRMFFAVPGQRIAIVMLIAVLVAARAAPTMGLWMAKVPRQSFGSITGRDLFTRAPGQPEDTVSPVESAPHDITLRGEQVAEVAHRSNRVLTGTLFGVGAVCLASSILAINPGAGSQWPPIVVVAVVALVLVLRARAFRDRRHAITVVGAASLSMIAIPAHYGLSAAPGATVAALVSAAGVLAVAVSGLIVGATVPSHFFSPPVRQVVEYLEYVLAALVIPFAAWAVGLLHYVRYH
ncbi:type VII secretion integral membrane protein EccD [Mycobacterium branderi]|uniref:ESX-2 secretion system protein eccD2 n=1 Tax=Mycobacterium branderi TaxID=43348 RepID=A0A7I7WDE6_9MYCO|nr:type VII secretion integral membrane protein EccD [Mycobacterium branderi]MCV7235246.1 type VII secretion integral membrane protein EccD [Mycobacterium branderi]ORA29882.1 type VII secretion integral membrane protein EccD [Mycobacterium branderi]BBZ15017.1 ESX-2 secretion system protein eccD2 [Mycobacterium branderi]